MNNISGKSMLIWGSNFITIVSKFKFYLSIFMSAKQFCQKISKFLLSNNLIHHFLFSFLILTSIYFQYLITLYMKINFVCIYLTINCLMFILLNPYYETDKCFTLPKNVRMTFKFCKKEYKTVIKIVLKATKWKT